MSHADVEGEVLAEEDASGIEADQVRPLPQPYEQSQAPVLRSDMRSAALAAAGGALAGVATVAAVRAVTAAGSRRRPARRSGRRTERPSNVIASRSFLVDVHLLGG
jgi:hypothetical protein